MSIRTPSDGRRPVPGTTRRLETTPRLQHACEALIGRVVLTRVVAVAALAALVSAAL